MIHSLSRGFVIPVFVFCCLAGDASAQTQSPAQEPIESMPIHAGPFGLRPSLSITSVGSDSNVFNVADSRRTISRRRSFRASSLDSGRGGSCFIRCSQRHRLFQNVQGRGIGEWDDRSQSRCEFGAASAVRVDRLGVNQGPDECRGRCSRPSDSTHHRRGHTPSIASRTAIVVNARRFDLDFDEGSEFRGSDLAHASIRAPTASRLESSSR